MRPRAVARKKLLKIASLLAVLATCAACGQKGDLFLPDKTTLRYSQAQPR